MEEAFFCTSLYREFAQLEEFGRLPDASAILCFRYRLKKHRLAEQIFVTLIKRGLLLKAGAAVNTILIAAPTRIQNKDRSLDPEMHSSKEGNRRYFGMKAHIGVDAKFSWVPIVHGTSGHVSLFRMISLACDHIWLA